MVGWPRQSKVSFFVSDNQFNSLKEFSSENFLALKSLVGFEAARNIAWPISKAEQIFASALVEFVSVYRIAFCERHLALSFFTPTSANSKKALCIFLYIEFSASALSDYLRISLKRVPSVLISYTMLLSLLSLSRELFLSPRGVFLKLTQTFTATAKSAVIFFSSAYFTQRRWEVFLLFCLLSTRSKSFLSLYV